MEQTARARSIAEARADNTAGRSSIRPPVGDGDVNLADDLQTITRVGARRAEPEAGRGLARAGGTDKRHAGSTAWRRAGGSVRASAVSPAEAGASYRTCTRSPLRRRSVTVPGLMSTVHEL